MPDTDRNDWLVDVKRHPEYDAALASAPGAGWLYLNYTAMVVFGLIFAVFSAFLVSVAPEGPSAFRIVWTIGALVFTFAGAGMVIYGLFRLAKVGFSRTRSVPALIAGKRAHVRRRSGTGSGSTTYYVTVELEDGRRNEVESRGRLYGKIAEGDTGVAHLRDRYLIGYRRLGRV